MDRELLDRIRSALRRDGIDAWMVFSSEYSEDPHFPWVIDESPPSRHLLVVPARAQPFVIASSLDSSMIRTDKRIFSSRAEFIKILKSLPYKKVALNYSRKGIEGISHNDFLTLRRYLKANVGPADFLADIRAVKTKKQLQAHRRACKDTMLAIDAIPSLIRKGSTEISLRNALYDIIDDEAFPTIVASGPNTRNPHHMPGNRKIREGDLLLVDIGSKMDMACADVSRTYAIGRATKRMQDCYCQVRSALDAVISRISPGARASSAAKAVPFEMHHAIGHPLGLSVHDVSPMIFSKSRDIFREGNVLAIEPAIYSPYGIRIEDDVIVSKNGTVRLTRAPAELPILKLN